MLKKANTFQFVLTALFLGIMILLASVPFLGFIPIGPLNATTMHIPVIIGSIVLGPRIGALLGGSFGIISLIRATTMPSALSFVFSPFIPVIGTNHGSWKALIVVLIPRILIGIVPYYVYQLCQKGLKNKVQPISLFIAGVSGGLTNTILVMNFIYFLFQKDYAQVIGKGGHAVYAAVNAVILTQGIPEAIVAGVFTSAVAAILLKLMKKQTN